MGGCSMSTAVEEKTLQWRTSVGFWVYLMTDCILFASLFATFAVLRTATAGGPDGREIFGLPLVLAETMILLTSSYACGLALLGLKSKNTKQLMTGLVITGILGISFLAIELSEFVNLVHEGHSWQQSAFLSAFFTLVGTHGLHILVGLIWLAVLLSVIVRHGVSSKTARQLTLFGMFWHFLDLIWIFIFTVVYLYGVAL